MWKIKSFQIDQQLAHQCFFRREKTSFILYRNIELMFIHFFLHHVKVKPTKYFGITTYQFDTLMYINSVIFMKRMPYMISRISSPRLDITNEWWYSFNLVGFTLTFHRKLDSDYFSPPWSFSCDYSVCLGEDIFSHTDLKCYRPNRMQSSFCTNRRLQIYLAMRLIKLVKLS